MPTERRRSMYSPGSGLFTQMPTARCASDCTDLLRARCQALTRTDADEDEDVAYRAI